MNTLLYALIAIVSLCIGIFIGRLSKNKHHGIFVIDDSENAEAKWTLRLFVDPNDIPIGKNANFKVIHKSKEVV